MSVFGHGESVVVVSAGTRTDRHGTVSESWAEADVSKRSVVLLVPPEPRPSQEPTQDARNAIVSGWTLYLPADDPISRMDRVRVRGVEFPVQGEPARWPRGVVVQAYRTTG